MPDISNCEGDGWAIKATCYRPIAIPSGMQSYFTNSPVNDDGTCDYFMEIWDKNKGGEQ